MLSRQYLLVVFLSLSCSLSLAHFASPSVKSISIQKVDSGKHTVTLPDRRSKTSSPLAECSFTYKTSEQGPVGRSAALRVEEKKLAIPDKQGNVRIDVTEIATQLDGVCVTSGSDYWSYELCFGQYLKQYHGGDVYWLARGGLARPKGLLPDGKSYVMDGGDMCSALSPPKSRQVQVNWACRKSATMPQIVTITETMTCVYSIQVASKLVCSDDRFPVLSDAAPQPAGNFYGSGAHEQGLEDWYIELVELESADANAAPVLMCQAYSLEYRAAAQKALKFENFELAINRLQGDNRSGRQSIAQLPPEYQNPTVRRPGRRPLGSSLLDSSTYGAVSLDPTSSDPYDGGLALLKVYA